MGNGGPLVARFQTRAFIASTDSSSLVDRANRGHINSRLLADQIKCLQWRERWIRFRSALNLCDCGWGNTVDPYEFQFSSNSFAVDQFGFAREL